MPDRSTPRRSDGRAAARKAPRGRRRWLPLGLAAGILLVLLGGLLWANRSAPGLEQAQLAAIQAARSEGDPNAPVVVEEWGDFQ